MTVQTETKTRQDAVTLGVIPYIQVVGANEAVDFYKRAFGAKERSRAPTDVSWFSIDPTGPTQQSLTSMRGDTH